LLPCDSNERGVKSGLQASVESNATVVPRSAYSKCDRRTRASSLVVISDRSSPILCDSRYSDSEIGAVAVEADCWMPIAETMTNAEASVFVIRHSASTVPSIQAVGLYRDRLCADDFAVDGDLDEIRARRQRRPAEAAASAAPLRCARLRARRAPRPALRAAGRPARLPRPADLRVRRVRPVAAPAPLPAPPARPGDLHDLRPAARLPEASPVGWPRAAGSPARS